MQSAEPFNYNDRYGIKKTRSWVWIALSFGIAGIVWVTWAGLYHSNPSIRTQLISFSIESDRQVSVRYSVDRQVKDEKIYCTLIARDFDKNIVGQLDQEIPQGFGKIELVTLVSTRSEAVNADVTGCSPR